MKLGKYIRELILENDTVIIPGFGAFISTYKPSEIDELNHQILPPSKEISFTQKIRNNDGLLVGCIASDKKISHFEALQKIEKERENLLYQLDKEGKVSIEDAGFFYYDDNREIQFSEDKNLLQHINSYGLDSISLPDISEKEDNSALIPEEELIANSVISEKNLRPEKENRKRRLWWLLLLLIPVAGGGYYFFFFEQEELPPTVETEINIPVEQPIILPEEEKIALDSVSSDSAEVYVETPVAETKDSSLVKTDSLPGFYLITGSFKEEKNVDKFIAKMKDEGFEPFYLGKKGNFYLVGIGWYKTEREALVAQDSFLAKNPDSGAWVHEE